MDVSNESYNEEIDEDFERQKKSLEEELQRIVAESDPDMVADKILSAAESIQKLADNFGNEEVNLSPSIERLKLLTTEQAPDVTGESDSKHEGSPLPTVLSKHLPRKSEGLISLDVKLPIVVVGVECQSDQLRSINAVPKVRLRSDDEMFINKTNSKRNTIGGWLLHWDMYIKYNIILYYYKIININSSLRPCPVQQIKSQ